MGLKQRYTVQDLAKVGVQLSGSPTKYAGSDLRVAKNVVINRALTAEGLVKRPGLFPVLREPMAGSVRGLVSVPLRDPNEVPIRYLMPTSGETWRTSVNSSDWEDLSGLQPLLDVQRYKSILDVRDEELYSLRLSDAKGPICYYVPNSFYPDAFQSYPSSLRSTDSVVDQLVIQVEELNVPQIITSVKSATRHDGTDFVYGASAVIGDSVSILRMGSVNLKTGERGAVDLIEPTFDGIAYISDIFPYESVPVYLVKSGNGGFLYHPDTDDPVEFTNQIPVSLAIFNGIAYVGTVTPYNENAENRAEIIAVDLETGTQKPIFRTSFESPRVSCTSLIIQNRNLYFVAGTPDAFAIYAIEDLSDEIATYSVQIVGDTGIEPLYVVSRDSTGLRYPLPARKVGGAIYFPFYGEPEAEDDIGDPLPVPGATVRFLNDNFAVVDRPEFTGPVVGVTI